MQTYLSTDWLVVDSTMVKVVLTDESEAYLISVAKAGKTEAEFFKLDARKLRRKDFFNAVMDAWREAEKLPIERAFEMRFLSKVEFDYILELVACV